MPGEAFSFSDGAWKTAEEKVSRAPGWDLPGTASMSTSLQFLFYPVAEYLRFCFYKIPLL